MWWEQLIDHRANSGGEFLEDEALIVAAGPSTTNVENLKLVTKSVSDIEDLASESDGISEG